MTTIRRTIRIDDVLTDMDSVLLRDKDGTYGVKRNDTGEVVVAAGTAMTKESTGVYTHTFDDPALDLTYTYVLQVTYTDDDGRTEVYWSEFTIPGAQAADAETEDDTPASIAAAITESAKGPRRARGEAGEVEQHPIPDLIAADKYARSRAAADRAADRGLGVKFVQLRPPGA